MLDETENSITVVSEEPEQEEFSFISYSPIDHWKKEDDDVYDVFTLSTDDEFSNDVEEKARRISASKSSDLNITSDKRSTSDDHKHITVKTDFEECEILIEPKKSENGCSSQENVNTINADPQCSKTDFPENEIQIIDDNPLLIPKSEIINNEINNGTFEIHEIIDESIIEADESNVVTIHDTDSEPEICSTPPNSRKRKISINSSPIAVCSKHITAAVNTQHTEARLTHFLLSDIDLISEKLGIDKRLVHKVVKMIVDDCTVPFISRYRQHDLQGLNCDNIREISETFKELKRANKRVEEIEKVLNKRNCWSTDLKEVFSKCMDIAEVEKLYLPYESEADEAVRARHLCLDESAKQILVGASLDANDFVQISCNGLETLDKINSGWQAVITDIICKDTDVMSYMSTLFKEEVPVIETELEDEKVAEVYRNGGESIVRKYLKFNNWKMPINSVDTQTVFKINRGEKEGLLRVYVVFNEIIEKKLRQFCMTKWSKCSPTILNNCIYTAWDNFMKPNYAQHIRWELTNEAHKVALKVFRDNVKYLLLEEPIRGKTVLGIDPGYDNGCKLAVISPWGVPIASSIVYVTSNNGKLDTCSELKRLVFTFECDIVALGNGTGCREIEALLRSMINQNQFRPFVITYKVVSESGVSCYSVSNEAAKEFPDLSPNIISAVSIARRLQDPLSELVKTDPKKLEVGMYIRDIESERVEEIFSEVVVECVSFVGVDVNIASSVLLSKVSGITPEIANNIIETRIQNGPFKSREQLRSVEGVTPKHFEQFVGFVRIIPETSQIVGVDFNFLDATIVHPESYEDAEKLLKYMGVEKQSIGTPYISDVIESILKRFEIRDLAVFCSTSVSTITFLLDVFRKPLNHDLRFEQSKSFYKSTIAHWEDLRPNMQLTGRIVNVTPIGAFIDVGLGGGRNAYLPPSNQGYDLFGKLVPRQIVKVQVTRIDTFTRKFKVRLIKILE